MNIVNNTESLLDPSNLFGLDINREKTVVIGHISLPECGPQSLYENSYISERWKTRQNPNIEKRKQIKTVFVNK
jgi:hypothetical protein